jgi:hypothetical protein
LEVVDPGWETLGRDYHPACSWEIWLRVVLYLEISYFARIDRSGELRGEREVGVVEGDNELALLVEWVLEVYACWLCTRWALNRSL